MLPIQIVTKQRLELTIIIHPPHQRLTLHREIQFVNFRDSCFWKPAEIKRKRNVVNDFI